MSVIECAAGTREQPLAASQPPFVDTRANLGGRKNASLVPRSASHDREPFRLLIFSSIAAVNCSLMSSLSPASDRRCRANTATVAALPQRRGSASAHQ